MGSGLILVFLLLCLVLVFYVIKSLNGAAPVRKETDHLYRYGLQIYVDMHKMKKLNRTISVDDSYVGLLSGYYQTLITLMLKLGDKGKSYQGNAQSKDWHVKRICVGGVDVRRVPPEEGKALLKASLDLLKFRSFRVEWIEGCGGVWNVKGFNDSNDLGSIDIVNIYLSEAKPTQIPENNTGRNLKGGVAPSDKQLYSGSQPGVAQVDRTERVAMLLRPGPEVIAKLVCALQEHIRRREANAAFAEIQDSSLDTSGVRELQEVVAEISPNEDENINMDKPDSVSEQVVEEEIVMPLRAGSELAINLVSTLQEHIEQREVNAASAENQCPPSDISDNRELQEVVAEVATEKSGNICVNLLDSSSELVVSIPAISVFEAIKIMDERKKRGYYTGLDDMKKRLDIDPVRLDQFSEYFCFSLP